MPEIEMRPRIQRIDPDGVLVCLTGSGRVIDLVQALTKLLIEVGVLRVQFDSGSQLRNAFSPSG